MRVGHVSVLADALDRLARGHSVEYLAADYFGVARWATGFSERLAFCLCKCFHFSCTHWKQVVVGSRASSPVGTILLVHDLGYSTAIVSLDLYCGYPRGEQGRTPACAGQPVLAFVVNDQHGSASGNTDSVACGNECAHVLPVVLVAAAVVGERVRDPLIGAARSAA
jgi:hypothetical protein